MKRLFKWLLGLLLLAVISVVLLVVFKDSILRVVVENRIREQTGMEAQIGKFSSSLRAPEITLQNLKLYNTAAFGGTPFLDLPELHLEIDPVALAQHKLHVTLARFNLAELDIVRNELGQTNLSFLAGQLPSGKSGGGKIKLREFEFTGVDVLDLSLGAARFIDLADKRNNHEIRLDLQHQIFKNVKTEADLYGIGVLLWLRSGGNLSLAPINPTNHP